MILFYISTNYSYREAGYFQACLLEEQENKICLKPQRINADLEN